MCVVDRKKLVVNVNGFFGRVLKELFVGLGLVWGVYVEMVRDLRRWGVDV